MDSRQLLPLVRSGALQFEVFKALAFPFTLGTAYSNEVLEAELTEAGGLVEPPKEVSGPLFTVHQRNAQESAQEIPPFLISKT